MSVVLPLLKPFENSPFKVELATVKDVPEIAALYAGQEQAPSEQTLTTRVQEADGGFIKAMRNGIEAILGYRFSKDKAEITEIRAPQNDIRCELDLLDEFVNFAHIMHKCILVAHIARDKYEFLNAVGFNIQGDEASTTVDAYLKNKMLRATL